MHDLALDLGMTVGMLEGMPEQELVQWHRYAMKRSLPSRRLEMYLAQICLVLARTAGNKDLKMTDFVLDFEVKSEPVDMTAVKEAFGFAPRKKKHG